MSGFDDGFPTQEQFNDYMQAYGFPIGIWYFYRDFTPIFFGRIIAFFLAFGFVHTLLTTALNAHYFTFPIDNIVALFLIVGLLRVAQWQFFPDRQA